MNAPYLTKINMKEGMNKKKNYFPFNVPIIKKLDLNIEKPILIISGDKGFS